MVYPSNLLVFVLYLIIPTAGDPGLSAVVPIVSWTASVPDISNVTVGVTVFIPTLSVENSPPINGVVEFEFSI